MATSLRILVCNLRNESLGRDANELRRCADQLLVRAAGEMQQDHHLAALRDAPFRIWELTVPTYARILGYLQSIRDELVRAPILELICLASHTHLHLQDVHARNLEAKLSVLLSASEMKMKNELESSISVRLALLLSLELLLPNKQQGAQGVIQMGLNDARTNLHMMSTSAGDHHMATSLRLANLENGQSSQTVCSPASSSFCLMTPGCAVPTERGCGLSNSAQCRAGAATNRSDGGRTIGDQEGNERTASRLLNLSFSLQSRARRSSPRSS